jgi:hypothetical protein
VKCVMKKLKIISVLFLLHVFVLYGSEIQLTLKLLSGKKEEIQVTVKIGSTVGELKSQLNRYYPAYATNEIDVRRMGNYLSDEIVISQELIDSLQSSKDRVFVETYSIEKRMVRCIRTIDLLCVCMPSRCYAIDYLKMFFLKNELIAITQGLSKIIDNLILIKQSLLSADKTQRNEWCTYLDGLRKNISQFQHYFDESDEKCRAARYKLECGF